MRITFLCCSWLVHFKSENDLLPWLHQLETSSKKLTSDASALFSRKQMRAEGRRRATHLLAEAASGRCRRPWSFYRCQHSARTSKTWTNENWVSYSSLLFQHLQTLVMFTSLYNHIIWHPENAWLHLTVPHRRSSKMAKLHWKWPATGTFSPSTLAITMNLIGLFSVFWIFLLLSMEKTPKDLVTSSQLNAP